MTAAVDAGPVITETKQRVPVVSYLALDPPRLISTTCISCGAHYFDRRNACASCGGDEFSPVDVASTGVVTTFTIVAFAAPEVEVPFVSAVVDCGGIRVRANLINVTPDPAHVQLGMRVRLATYSMGLDASGVEAVGFGFEPQP